VKTISLKKVAVVAVASLGFGLLSVVPANAADAQVADGTISALNATKATANTYVAGTSNKIFVGATNIGEAALGAGDGLLITLKAAVTTYPSAGYIGAAGDASGTLDFTGGNTDTPSANQVLLQVTDNTALTAETISSTGTNGLAAFTVTPSVAGDYAVTIWHDQDGDGTVDLTEARTTVTMTIVAAADLNPGGTVAYMTGTTAGDAAAASATSNAIPRSGSKTAGTYIAQIALDLKKTDNSDDDRAHTVTATVSGQGYVTVNTTADTDPNGTGRVSTDNSAQSERYVHIEADGTAGSGSVTLSVTHVVTGVTTTIGTWSWTTYGSVTKLEVSEKVYTIGRAGYTTGAADANLDDRTVAHIPAFVIKMTDSSGRPALRGALPTFVSSNAAVITGGDCAIDDGLDDYSSSTNGVGFYNCNFDTSPNAKSGDKATLTLRVTNPADTTTFLSTTIDLTVGGSVAKEVMTTDKTTYAPGEAMKVTVTATDASGNPVYDGAATVAGIVSNKNATGLPTTASVYVGGKKVFGSLGGVYAPAIGGTFTLSATGTDSASTAVSASATVTDANAGLLTQIDALNAKIVALNALIAKIMKKLGVK